MQLLNVKKDTRQNTVSYIAEQINDESSDVFNFKKVKHVHEITNHKQEENMLYAYRNAGILTDGGRKVIKRVINSCKVCKKFKQSFGTPKTAIPKPVDFIEIVRISLETNG